MERRQFTREFKLEAVRLIKQRGVSYAQASNPGKKYYAALAAADRVLKLSAAAAAARKVGDVERDARRYRYLRGGRAYAPEQNQVAQAMS